MKRLMAIVLMSTAVPVSCRAGGSAELCAALRGNSRGARPRAIRANLDRPLTRANLENLE